MSKEKKEFHENPLREAGISDELWLSECQKYGVKKAMEIAKFLSKFHGKTKKLEAERDRIYNSKETIWDYKPTEKEIREICEKEELTMESILTESRKGKCRLFCLLELFRLRGKSKEMDRIEREFNYLFPLII